MIIWPVRKLDKRARDGVVAVLGAATQSARTLAESDALLDILHGETVRVRQARLALLERPSRRRRGGGETDARRALVVDEQWPRPDRDAGSQAVLSHMRALQRLGWRVEFAAAQAMQGDADASAQLQADGIVVHAAPAVHLVEEVLRRQPDCYGLVYLHRMSSAVAYAGLARQQQRRARLIYSVADLHHLRLARQAQIEARPELLRAARTAQAQDVAENAASLARLIVICTAMRRTPRTRLGRAGRPVLRRCFQRQSGGRRAGGCCLPASRARRIGAGSGAPHSCRRAEEISVDPRCLITFGAEATFCQE